MKSFTTNSGTYNTQAGIPTFYEGTPGFIFRREEEVDSLFSSLGNYVKSKHGYLKTEAGKKIAALLKSIESGIKSLLSALSATISNHCVRIYEVIHRILTTMYLVSSMETLQEKAMIIIWQLSPYAVELLAKKHKFIRKFGFNLSSVKKFVDTEYEAQGMSLEDSMMGMIDSDLANSILDITREAIQLELIPEDLRGKITPWIGTVSFMERSQISYLSFSKKILTTSLNLCKTVKGFMSGDMEFIDLISSPKDSFLYRSFSCLHQKDFWKLTPEVREHRETLQDNYREIKRTMRLHDCLSNKEKLNKSVNANYYAIKRLADTYSERIRTLHRKVPFGIIIHGPPGVGKGSIMVGCHKIFCEFSGRKYSDSLVYERNTRVEYWDNYDPAEHPIVHFPEVGATHSSIASRLGDPILNEVLNVQNDTPYMAQKAAVEDKGKYMVTPEFLTIDTNNDTLNAPQTMNNPTAIFRRFLFIKVTVKDHYTKEGGTALDSDKVGIIDNPMDLWDFEIYYRIPKTNFQYTKRKLHSEPTVPMAGLRYYLLQELANSDRKHNSFKLATSMEPKDYGDYRPAPFVAQSLLIPPGMSRREAADTTSSQSPSTTIIDSTPWREVFWNFWEKAKWYGKRLYNMILYYYYRLKRFIVSRFHRVVATTVWKRYGPSGSYLKGVASVVVLLTAIKLAVCGYEASKYVSQSDVADYKVQTRKFEDRIGAGFDYPKPKSANCNDWSGIQVFKSRTKFDKRCYNKLPECISAMNKNIRHIRILCIDPNNKENEGSVSGLAMGIKSNVMIFNSHILKSIENANAIQVSNSADHRSGYVEHFLDSGTVKFVSIRTDITLMAIKNCCFGDVLNLFVPNLKSLENVCIKMEPNDTNGEYNSSSTDVRFHNESISLDNYIRHDVKLPKKGDCGTPRMATINNGHIIVGIHAAGIEEKDSALCAVVTQEMLNKGLDQVSENVNYLSQGHIPLPEGMQLGPVNRRSPLWYEEHFSFKVFGDIHGNNRSKPITRLRPYPWGDDIEKVTKIATKTADGMPKFGIPVMSYKKVNGNYLAPLNNWLKKVNHEKPDLDSTLLKDIEDVILERLLANIPDKNLRPLTVFQALNGVKDNFYIRSMNFSTSAGSLWPGKKKAYTIYDEATQTHTPSPRLYESILEIFDCYDRGELSHRVLGAQLKDEVLPWEKVLMAKTRVFFTAPIDTVVVQRMFLAPFYSIMVSDRTTFCCRLGVNMHSIEADQIYRDMADEDFNIMEGDYSGYDVSFPYDIALTGNRITYRFLAARGYSKEALVYLRAILEENMLPTVNFNNTIMIMPGIQPSGKYGTAEDNSLKGLILLMYAWHKIMCDVNSPYYAREGKTAFSLHDFFRLVRPNIYGDDVLAAVHKSAEEFNALSYAKFCKDEYRSKFTASSKGEVTVPYVSVEEMSFLKRNFHYHPLLKRYVAALDKDSLVKMTSYFIPSTYADDRTQATEMMCSYLREAFLHMDTREEYERQRQGVIDLITHYYHNNDDSLQGYFPTYETLMMSLEEEEQVVYEAQAIGAVFRIAKRLPKIVKTVKKHKPLRSAIKDAKGGKGFVKSLAKRSINAKRGKVPRGKAPKQNFMKNLKNNVKGAMKDTVNDIKSSAKDYARDTGRNLGSNAQSYFSRSLGGSGMRTAGSGMAGPDKLVNTFARGTYTAQSADVNRSTENEGGQEIVTQEFTEGAEHVEGEISHSPEHIVPTDYTIIQMLSQYVYCGSIKESADSRFNPYIMWATNPVINDILLKHTGFRCNLELSVTWDMAAQSAGYYVWASYPIVRTNNTLTRINANTDPNGVALRMYLSQNEYAVTIQLEKHTHLNMLIPFVYEKPFVPLDFPVKTVMTSLAELSTVVVSGWGISVPVDFEFEIKIRAVDLELDVRTEYQAQSNDPEPQINHIEVERPNVDGSLDEEDETGIEGTMQTFEEICAMQTIIGEIPFSGSQKNEMLACIPVTPLFGKSINIGRDATALLCPMGWVAMAFRQWRGTMRYRFTVVASKYAKGKLLFSYQPSPRRWGAPQHPMQGMGSRREYILELGGQRELEIAIGMSNRDYYKCGIPERLRTEMGNFVSADAKRDEQDWHNREFCNGFVSVQTIGSIQGLTVNTDLRIVVEAWMTEPEFFVPNTTIDEDVLPYKSLEQAQYVAQSADPETFENEIITFRSIKPPITGKPNFAQLSFDNVYTMTGTMQQKALVTTGANNTNQILLFDRELPLVTRGSNYSNGPGRGVVRFSYTFYDHFKQMFVFKRGNLRFMLDYPNQTSNVMVASTFEDTFNNYVPINWIEWYPPGATTFNINLTTGPYEFASMSMAGTMFEPTIKSLSRVYKYANPLQRVVAGIPRIGKANVNIRLMTSTGHNFKFMYFIGCPLFEFNDDPNIPTKFPYQEKVEGILRGTELGIRTKVSSMLKDRFSRSETRLGPIGSLPYMDFTDALSGVLSSVASGNSTSLVTNEVARKRMQDKNVPVPVAEEIDDSSLHITRMNAWVVSTQVDMDTLFTMKVNRKAWQELQSIYNLWYQAYLITMSFATHFVTLKPKEDNNLVETKTRMKMKAAVVIMLRNKWVVDELGISIKDRRPFQLWMAHYIQHYMKRPLKVPDADGDVAYYIYIIPNNVLTIPPQRINYTPVTNNKAGASLLKTKKLPPIFNIRTQPLWEEQFPKSLAKARVKSPIEMIGF